MNCGETVPREPARHLTIDEGHAGQRIDNFLSARLREVPRGHIYKILRRGEVRVNKRRARQDYRLRVGDVVRIPPVHRRASRAAPNPPAAVVEELAARTLYESAGVVVLDKPSGVPVHGGTAASAGVIDALRALRPAARFLELVHRLDRETSGCLVVAKTRAALKALHGSLRERRVEKRYLVLVRGRWRGGCREVDLPLRKNVLQSGERMVKQDPLGKRAVTVFEPIATGETASLLAARTLTGRTHQIRVHAAAAGHPIAGDRKYGDRELNRGLRGLGLRRMFLHAASVAFREPDSDERIRVTAPLPAELQAVLAALGMERPGDG